MNVWDFRNGSHRFNGGNGNYNVCSRINRMSIAYMQKFMEYQGFKSKFECLFVRVLGTKQRKSLPLFFSPFKVYSSAKKLGEDSFHSKHGETLQELQSNRWTYTEN